MSSITLLILFINLIKTKIIALIVGPSGMGIYSLFMSLYTMIVAFTSIGSGASVVKAVAEINTVNDIGKFNYLNIYLSFILFLVGSLFSFLLFIFSPELSYFAFSDYNHGLEIKLISFIIILAIFSNFWQSWLNGLKKIKEIAKIRVLTALFSTIFTIIFIYFYSEKGIIYGIITIPLFSFFITGYFFLKEGKINRNISIVKDPQIIKDVFKIGIFLLLISLLFQVGVYLNRNIITNALGIQSLGIFFAAWTISMSYIEIFLSSLAVDYYPRLVEKRDSISSCNEIINEQIYLSLIITFPLILFIYIHPSFVISILYSNDFLDSINILKWQIIGDIFKIMVWLFGYLLIVQNRLRYSFLIQLIWVSLYSLILYFGLDIFGIELAGIAFLICYAISFLMLYIYIKINFGFYFTKRNIKLFFIIIICLIFVSFSYENLIYILIKNTILIATFVYTYFIIKGIYAKK